ncbi:hypothetical protein C2869_19380 [Saccharobesus litoralis]|uniref:RNA polymerase sigma factor n=1 Tax=Saccharobesus litoralis TaxID=2172099 RepID=A0A2S0VW40_9ALTE|nr:RNA polymerase sigma factor [Saccharobesus litoralis]AWB68436.1 hypothetical protein C2869_19380 [Saccharobesus litoralis]
MGQLLQLFAGKQKQLSFEALLAPYMNLMFKVAYQYTGSHADAEDLLQDLLIDLYANQQKLQGIEKLKPWLMRCLYNKFIDSYRKNKHLADVDSLDNEQVVSLAAYASEHDDKVLHQQIIAGLAHLSSSHRAVLCLHDMNGYSLPELSEILDKPLGTLKSDLHRAREKLKMSLKLQPSDVGLRQVK